MKMSFKKRRFNYRTRPSVFPKFAHAPMYYVSTYTNPRCKKSYSRELLFCEGFCTLVCWKKDETKLNIPNMGLFPTLPSANLSTNCIANLQYGLQSCVVQVEGPNSKFLCHLLSGILAYERRKVRSSLLKLSLTATAYFSLMKLWFNQFNMNGFSLLRTSIIQIVETLSR